MDVLNQRETSKLEFVISKFSFHLGTHVINFKFTKFRANTNMQIIYRLPSNSTLSTTTLCKQLFSDNYMYTSLYRSVMIICWLLKSYIWLSYTFLDGDTVIQCDLNHVVPPPQIRESLSNLIHAT